MNNESIKTYNWDEFLTQLSCQQKVLVGAKVRAQQAHDIEPYIQDHEVWDYMHFVHMKETFNNGTTTEINALLNCSYSKRIDRGLIQKVHHVKVFANETDMELYMTLIEIGNREHPQKVLCN